MPVRVVTDSACDLPQALADELGLLIVPLTVRFASEELLDRRDLTPTELWARWASFPERPETAAPAPAQFEAAYRALAGAGADGIVVVTVSSLLSGTLQSAQLAAARVAGAVTISVVDSRSITIGLGMVAAAAARLARGGASREEVTAAADEIAARTHVIAALDPADQRGRRLGHGGPRSGLAAAVGRQAVVEVRDGKLHEDQRRRTRQAALDHLVARVAGAGSLDALSVFHTEAADLDSFVSRIAPLAPGPPMVTDTGAVLGALCGPGTLGVAYQVAYQERRA
jgi:DegV family protein with EDD domain